MKNKEGVCMACSCPCDMHKEHNHDVKKSGKTCAMCGHEHGKDGKCACGCGK